MLPTHFIRDTSASFCPWCCLILGTWVGCTSKQLGKLMPSLMEHLLEWQCWWDYMSYCIQNSHLKTMPPFWNRAPMTIQQPATYSWWWMSSKPSEGQITMCIVCSTGYPLNPWFPNSLYSWTGITAIIHIVWLCQGQPYHQFSVIAFNCLLVQYKVRHYFKWAHQPVDW